VELLPNQRGENLMTLFLIIIGICLLSVIFSTICKWFENKKYLSKLEILQQIFSDVDGTSTIEKAQSKLQKLKDIDSAMKNHPINKGYNALKNIQNIK
jgi:hypothetical protein